MININNNYLNAIKRAMITMSKYEVNVIMNEFTICLLSHTLYLQSNLRDWNIFLLVIMLHYWLDL